MISYSFVFEDASVLDFAVDETGCTSVESDDEEYPEWVRLETFRCPHCPVPEGSRATCPAALSILPAVEAFESRLSFETVKVVIENREMTTTATVPLPKAVRSLLGLLMPLSGCPVLAKLSPMARIHVPLANEVHTAFRFLGMHLIVEAIRRTRGEEVCGHLDELLDVVKALHVVNRCLAERIRLASSRDAAVNALVVLDCIANAVEWTIEDSFAQLDPIFDAYFAELAEPEE